MQLLEARTLARTLMNEHGLTDWDFAFDNAVKRFGQTRYTDKTITISKHLTELNESERVKNTILHKIAHALCPVGTGHKYKWVRMARTIGCDGYRGYNTTTTVTPTMNYLATCSVGHAHKRVQRPRGTYLCRSTNEQLIWSKQ